MEFDDLKRAWEECDRTLDTGMHLNARRLRSSIPGKGNAARNRLSRVQIDFSAPVVVFQQRLEALHVETRGIRKWMWLRAPLACTLLVMVALVVLTSLFGMNVSRVIGPAGIALAVVFGLLAGAAWLRRSLASQFDGADGADGAEMLGTFQVALLRVLRRHRVFRG